MQTAELIKFLIIGLVVFISLISPVSADDLIYDNSTLTGGAWNAGTYIAFMDYGSSPGGRVSKFAFDYVTTSSTVGVIWVNFYRYTYRYDPGYPIKTFTLTDVPSTGGWIETCEYVIPEEDRFELPPGDFGYSFEVSRSTTYIANAHGGQDNEDYFWVWSDLYDDFLLTYFSNDWSGFSMQIYSLPPIDEITCDIFGYKFEDADGNGQWDTGEPGLPGWEFYIDQNSDGIYQTSEPNAVTDPNGLYFFENIEFDTPGDPNEQKTFIIREMMKDGWIQTLPGGPDDKYTLIAEPNNVYGPYNFGNTPWAGTAITLDPIADTYASQSNPDSNFGTANTLAAGLSGSQEYRAFIKFDLSSISPGRVVVSAKLQLDGSFVTSPAPSLWACRSSSSWEENTLTWNNMPSINYPRDCIEEQVASIAITEWDVTDFVDDEYISFQDRVVTIALMKSISTPSGAYASFWTKDTGVSSWRPKLVIQYEPIFGGGTGERSDPYQIKTGEQMNTIGLYSNRWGKHYKLMNDISLAAYPGTLYNIIGLSKPAINSAGAFTGTFDGDYHKISGFSYSNASGDIYVGLFGYASEAILRNIIIESPNIQNTGDLYDVGALVGYMYWGHIADCSVEGGSVSGYEQVGGLIGASSLSCIAGCSSSAAVSGTQNVGGLIGEGGFSSIENSNATGSVSGTDSVGGFIGSSADTTLRNCYSSGLVAGSTNTGGFSGINENQMLYEQQNVFNCFWDETASGQPESAAGTKSDTSAMQTQTTFTNVGWDFVGEVGNGGSDDWAIPPGGGYPVHWYQWTTPPALPIFTAGNGTAGNPFQIGTIEQLNSIGHNSRLLKSHFELIADLDLNGTVYYPIANGPYVFRGTFDGGQHTISNIEINKSGYYSKIGFMGHLEGPDAVLKNTILQDPNVSGTWSMELGSLLGRNTEALVENCHVINTNVIGWNNIGGLVGHNYWYATMRNCTAVGGTANEFDLFPFLMSPVGGLAGSNSWWSQMDACSADVDVFGEEYLGGLVGYCLLFSDISNSCARGTVTTTKNNAGGLCYRVVGGDLTNCYSTAEVMGPPEATGLTSFVRSGSSGTFTACMWDESVNGSMTGIDDTSRLTLIDVGPESTENMQMAATYQAIGWDFSTVWQMRCQGMNYPRLQSEPLLTGDFTCPEGVEMNDLIILTNEWLAETGVLTADIAPADAPDGKVNLLDLALFAEHWILGTD